MGVDATIFAETALDLGGEQFAKDLSYDAAVAFGFDKFMIHEAGSDYPAQRAITYYHDKDCSNGHLPHTYIVNTWSRYYCEDYQRGDWMFLSMLMRFLRAKISDAVIYYWSDSDTTGSQYNGKPFTLDDHAHMDAVFFNLNQYRSDHSDDLAPVVKCSFCEQPMYNSGGDGKSYRYLCPGCGQLISCDRKNLKHTTIHRCPGEIVLR